MGSQVVDDPPEFVVLVTGFLGGNCVTRKKPFRSQWPVNPSWEIAKRLPSYLPPPPPPPPAPRAKDADAAQPAVDLPPVRILVHPEPLRVSYKYVRDLVPSFWDTYEGYTVDAVVHIGMAGPRTSYQLERRAHRRGYRSVDVDGEAPEEGVDGRPHDPHWIWYGLPDEIVSDLDMDDVHGRWRACGRKDMDLRISDDAGRFLCEWIYYCSLSHLLRLGRPKPVCFLHVPCDAAERQILQGCQVAVDLIRAIAESEVSRREKGEQAEGGAAGQ